VPGESSTTEVARQKAGNVGQSTTRAAGQVAQTTKEQAREVVGEAGRQVRDLAGEVRAQIREQTGNGRDRVVSGLRALGDELEQMAQRGGQSGAATQLARRASGRSHDVARYLDEREPGQLVEEARSFARRRSGMFLIGAALAGVVAGRLTRASVSQSGGQQEPSGAAGPATAGPATAGPATAGIPPVTAGEQARRPGTDGYGTPVYPAPVAGEPAYPAESEPALPRLTP